MATGWLHGHGAPQNIHSVNTQSYLLFNQCKVSERLNLISPALLQQKIFILKKNGN